MQSNETRFTQTQCEQFNGREGETATLLSRYLFKINGLGGGFAPRQRRRYAFFDEIK